jgi:hypothetical protein
MWQNRVRLANDRAALGTKPIPMPYPAILGGFAAEDGGVNVEGIR